MSNCIFCKIVAGEIASNKVYEDDVMVAIKDAGPVAPVHVLLMPKEHADSLLDVKPEVMEHIMSKVGEIAEKLGVKESGFRIVINTGEDGQQSVKHLHVHLIGGKQLGWPPC